MNLRAEQLAQHLEKNLAPLYVVHGDEPLLALEAADQIRAAARRQGYAEREVFTVEPGFRWDNLLFSGNSFSLFAARRVIDLRIPGGKPGTEGAAALKQYCEELPQDTVTLVTLPKLERAATNAQWFKALDAAGVVVVVYPVERSRLPQWIQARLAQQQQRAGAETLAFLADQVEGNLIAAKQELQKLALLLPPGELRFEQVKDAVLDVARYDVFKLGDAMLAGDAGRFARMLEGVRGEGAAATLVLWLLAQEVRTLARIKTGLGRGEAISQLLRAARVWESRQRLVEGALKRVAQPVLRNALRQAATLDRMIKGLAPGDVWDGLLQLGLTVARPSRG